MTRDRSEDLGERIGGAVFTALSALLAAFLLWWVEGGLAPGFGWPRISFWQSLGVVIALGSIVQYGTASMYWRGRERRRR